jgi:flagellar hook-associated protein 3 FlgL
MRVATAHQYDNTIANLSQRQNELSAQQDRISTGRRVQRASDDPVAAVLAETAQNRLSRVQADLRAVEASRTSLQQAESALVESGQLIQEARDRVIAGGNGSYGPQEREDLAKDLEGLRDRLLSVANRQDSAGRTLFGGLGGSSTPFVEVYGTATRGVRFEGLRGQEAAGNLALPHALDGEAIWMRIPPGNGSFTLGLAGGNTGAVRTDLGQVADPSALTGQAYRLSFADAADGTLRYTVTNTSTGNPVAGQEDVAYVPGTRVAFDGLSFQLQGTAKAGDAVEVRPVAGPTSLFQVVQDAIDALRHSGPNPGAQLTQAMGRALRELDAGHDRVLQARGQAGQWLNRADATEGLLDGRAVDLSVEKSRLEDLDMIQGISSFQRQQIGLEAALKSYAQVQRLSLFQYVG